MRNHSTLQGVGNNDYEQDGVCNHQQLEGVSNNDYEQDGLRNHQQLEGVVMTKHCHF